MQTITEMHQELSRLRALRECQILDTAPAKIFDELVELATLICQTPMGTISFLDQSRQWFKAKRGILLNETAREVAFCDYVVRRRQPFLVEDTLSDVRFENHPLVLGEPNIRFYAGFPVNTKEGCTVGTLCVMDRRARDLRRSELRALEILAYQASQRLEDFRREKILAQKEDSENLVEEMVHELNGPLAAITNKLEKIKRERFTLLPNEMTERVLDIEKSVGRVIRIIGSLRDFSSIEKNSAHEKILLGALVQEAIDWCREKINEFEIELFVEPIPEYLVIEGRAIWLSQVLVNLLQNAVEAVRGEGERWIKIACESTAQWTEIRILDSGSGIPHETREKIFKPFFSTKREGTGLGLSLSRRILRKHSGDLILAPPIQPTQFIMHLPKKGG